MSAASNLGLPLADIQATRFTDGETSVRAYQTVEGRDVFVVQSTSRPVNESLIDLALMITTVRRAGARHVTAVIPYYGYNRAVGAPPASMDTHSASLLRNADLARGRGPYDDDEVGTSPSVYAARATLETCPISAADVADVLEAAGVDSVISVDLQPPGQGQIEVCCRNGMARRVGQICAGSWAMVGFVLVSVTVSIRKCLVVLLIVPVVRYVREWFRCFVRRALEETLRRFPGSVPVQTLSRVLV